MKLRGRLLEPLRAFVDHGRLVLGICNGFQVLVKLGLLPNLEGECQQDVTLTFNDSGRFEDRWVYLKVNPASNCVFTTGVDRVYLPVRHGEGKFIPRDTSTLATLEARHGIVMRYTDQRRPARRVSLEPKRLSREYRGDLRRDWPCLRPHASSRGLPALHQPSALDP